MEKESFLEIWENQQHVYDVCVCAYRYTNTLSVCAGETGSIYKSPLETKNTTNFQTICNDRYNCCQNMSNCQAFEIACFYKKVFLPINYYKVTFCGTVKVCF